MKQIATQVILDLNPMGIYFKIDTSLLIMDARTWPYKSINKSLLTTVLIHQIKSKHPDPTKLK